ncbi:carbohydrate-binding domain-containing protein [Glycomyces arizonensis]|uniref:carbohydrate-binding domain-containing protein n=1 Tax=Glycomyces arizonensis TaxID=256035 RepID=UPI00047A8860|nr:carbohydrate-binding domain-containing protein [Glycomyces arizonensis]
MRRHRPHRPTAAWDAAAEDASNGYPHCANGSASDPDGDGWVWENGQSCVVQGGGGGGGGGLTCRHQAQSHWGEYVWFAGHRDGQTGLSNPNADDIDKYRTAVYWIKGQLESNSANRSNDTRFWVDVQAI